MKSLIDYIITEGHKQRVTNWLKFKYEGNEKYGHNTLEYYKYILDFFTEELLWEYTINFKESKTEDIMMGRSDIPAKRYTYIYECEGHEIKFVFNSFFAEPFVDTYIDDKPINEKLTGRSGDMSISMLVCDKNKIGTFKGYLKYALQNKK